LALDDLPWPSQHLPTGRDVFDEMIDDWQYDFLEYIATELSFDNPDPVSSWYQRDKNAVI
jgi:hypothetical protein